MSAIVYSPSSSVGSATAISDPRSRSVARARGRARWIAQSTFRGKQTGRTAGAGRGRPVPGRRRRWLSQKSRKATCTQTSSVRPASLIRWFASALLAYLRDKQALGLASHLSPLDRGDRAGHDADNTARGHPLELSQRWQGPGSNDDPRPFVWTASIESILEKVGRCKAVLETLG